MTRPQLPTRSRSCVSGGATPVVSSPECGGGGGLVQARRDLTIAFLAGPDQPDAAGLDLSWEALAAGAPTSEELGRVLWPDGGRTTASSLGELDRLDAGLEAYETRVAATLDNVTAQMVRALTHAHRDDGERGS